MHFLERSEVGLFSSGEARLSSFRHQRRHKKMAPERAPTSPAQRYYITPEGESPQPACKAKPITGRTLAAQGQRPGGWLNPHARKGVSTFGNTGKHRPGPDPDRAKRRLNPPAFVHTLSRPHISHIKSRHRNACFFWKERCFSIKRKEPICRLSPGERPGPSSDLCVRRTGTCRLRLRSP